MLETIVESKSLLTLVVVTLILILKVALKASIKRRAKNNNKDLRLLINILNNVLSFSILIVIFNIWSVEIQRFAFSIAAFSVAIVLATREFIQCFIGFIYIATSRPFAIGDWIQVGNDYGEVNDIDWAKLTILEVNIDDYKFTGETLLMPTSQLITSSIKNLNFLKRYAIHNFTITRDGSVNPFDFIDELNEKAIEYCADFNDVAIRYNQLIEHRLDIKIDGPEPHIQVATSELGDTQVIFTLFCPTEIALEIEQKLTADFMRLWFKERAKV